MASILESPRSISARGISILNLALLFGAVVFVGCILVRHLHADLGHDQVSYLFEAQRWMSGDVPYGPHISETNPPVIIWFSALPVYAWTLFHASPHAAFRTLACLLLLASTGWCLSILIRSRSATFSNPIAPYLFSWAILLVGISAGHYDFGQREHLLILFLLPYLLAVASGAVSQMSLAERCAMGVAAGIAIWFKPHGVLIVAAIELFNVLRNRTLRRVVSAQFVSLVATSGLILALVLVATPRYVRETVPLLLDTYWALGSKNTVALALSFKPYLLLLGLLLLACMLLRRLLNDADFLMAVLISSAAAFLSFAVQHTEWSYHRYPYKALLFLAVAYLPIDLLAPLFDRIAADPRRLRQISIGGLLLLALSVMAIVSRPLPSPFRTDVDRIFDKCPQGTTVSVFTTRVEGLASAYNHKLNWGSRFAHLWMMPAIVQNETGPLGPQAPFKRLSPEKLTRVSALQRAESAEDLNYWKPSVVLVEHCDSKHFCEAIEGKTFDVLAWLLRGEDFAKAWSHYERRLSPSANYDLYVRVH